MIQVSHLSKFYGPRRAIEDLNFDVKQGEIVGFLGPNGAGKSTTMKILTGFMPASEGLVTVAGHDVSKNPIAVKREIGYLPENPPLYMEMRVRDYLKFAAKIHGVTGKQVNDSVEWAMGKTHLSDVSHRIIGNLSKGYKQRVGIAQALVHRPKVLILDEPTVGLDPKQIIEIRELIKSLGGEHTVVLSSHILPEVTATCGRIIVINRGKIAAEDTMDGLTMKLKKGIVFSVLVKEPKPDGASLLRAIEGVSNVTAVGNKLIIEVKPDQGELRDRIAATVVQSGMGLLELTAERVSLEEIFLQLTTEEERIV
ncbi:MAG: ATP-binding cassette domain-containing protein [Proteobacteria bacterium]|nr:MAG: ATP-binding cassette domain-containing protein [Pseudomonadota bacterium]